MYDEIKKTALKCMKCQSKHLLHVFFVLEINYRIGETANRTSVVKNF